MSILSAPTLVMWLAFASNPTPHHFHATESQTMTGRGE